jgi:outer membrane protein assembly factor BamB
MPIASRPAIDGNRAYYVSNRGELVCVVIWPDARDNPMPADAKLPPKRAGEIRWKLDMVADLGVYKVEAPDIGNPICNPLVVGDDVYCVTGNGGDFNGVPAPSAPSFIAVDKWTGKIRWSSNAPGKNIVYGQWSSPALCEVDGHKQIVFPGGDGFLYGFEPDSGKMLWSIDLGGSVPAGDQHDRGLGRRNFFVGSPTTEANLICVGLDQIPEDNLMRTRRPFYAVELKLIDGKTVPRIKWAFDDDHFDGTTAAAAVSGGVVYVLSRSGYLLAINAVTGRAIWESKLDEPAALFSAPYVAGGALYASSEEHLFMFALEPAPRCLGCFDLGANLMNTTPVFSKGRLYVGAGGQLWALVPPPLR